MTNYCDKLQAARYSVWKVHSAENWRRKYALSKYIGYRIITDLSAVLLGPQANKLSEAGSVNLERCELLGLVSALLGRNNVTEVWFDDNTPEAEEGLEFEDHALSVGSCVLSLPEVDGRLPLPPDEGRPLR